MFQPIFHVTLPSFILTRNSSSARTTFSLHSESTWFHRRFCFVRLPYCFWVSRCFLPRSRTHQCGSLDVTARISRWRRRQRVYSSCNPLYLDSRRRIPHTADYNYFLAVFSCTQQRKPQDRRWRPLFTYAAWYPSFQSEFLYCYFYEINFPRNLEKRNRWLAENDSVLDLSCRSQSLVAAFRAIGSSSYFQHNCFNYGLNSFLDNCFFQFLLSGCSSPLIIQSC